MNKRKNKTVAKQELDIKLNQLKFTLIGDFNGSKKSSEFMCDKGHTWKTRPNRLKECPVCNRQNKALTKNDINDRLKPRNIVLIGEYVDLKTKTTFQCEHFHTWDSKPNNILYGGNGCPRCYNNSWDKKSINDKITERNIILLDDYINALTTHNFRCTTCNNEWMATPNNILRGKGCPKCYRLSTILPIEVVNSKLQEKNIKIIGEYTKCSEKTMFECEYGHTWETTPGHIIYQNTNCPVCAKQFGIYGVNYSLPGILYYLKIKNEFYKIGITTKKLRRRYSQTDLEIITPIKEIPFEKLIDAYREEQKILREYKEFLYKGPKILSSGNSEIFTKDVLLLDN